jgi:mono/diheme cytochrome c family protein
MKLDRPYKPLLVGSVIWLAVLPLASIEAAPAPAAAKMDFDREVRPILAENCYKCHGPDDGARKARLRFDLRTEALKPAKSGKAAIVPGAPQQSELIARITAADPDDRMPPLKTGKKLSPSQIDSLRRWIAQGAPYDIHWSYREPERPALPTVKNKRWPRGAIDYFVLARIEKEGLQPSPRADRYTLARRVSLDLTGLPPSLAEVDQFVGDRKPDAYERFVDRLLAKTAFGEHWARMWLDLARYADSAGYADDPPRTIWAYRDWVIRAFNENMPFDRFTIEQIAGDLLEQPDDEDFIATAYHRNTMTNNEGGTSDEEFRNAAVVDRVNTTMAVWMATSMGCAQCHNHKYDPLSQQDYFRLFAIFNNTADADLKDESPVLDLYTPTQKQQRAALQAQIAALETRLPTPTADSRASQAQWELAFPRDAEWLANSPAGLLLPTATVDQATSEYANLPARILRLVKKTPAARDQKEQTTLAEYYVNYIDPALKPERQRLAKLKTDLAGIQPNTVPIMRELAGDKRRKTHIQFRGNYQALGDEVTEGLPAVFHPPSTGQPSRLTLARWLVDTNNPLTARVIANRFWEQIFGTGIVRTCEDFGTQGDLPTHPELLDWLATELMARNWDMKSLLKLLVTSATYCQSSRVTPELQERDPDNLLLARGPRFRAPAEVIRDQALAVSGLLSRKLYGPPVRPPQPSMGLSAAFGSSFDWKTSEGEDRYRRALYTEWRRTSPYPSMTTFDAPNREVCALRRPRSNTPLQALVTLNDPVYVEAAQALARRMDNLPGSALEKARYGFRLCLARPPSKAETGQLVGLFEAARADYDSKPELAKQMVSAPPQAPAAEGKCAELAAWTTVANVLLNLDEMLMKP